MTTRRKAPTAKAETQTPPLDTPQRARRDANPSQAYQPNNAQSPDYNTGVRDLQGAGEKAPSIQLNLTPRGTPGLRHAGGYVIEEFLRKLIGRAGVQLYREIHFNSPQIGAILYFIESLVKRTAWRFEPNPESKNQKLAAENADFFEQCRTDMEHTWGSFIEESLTYLMYGWALFEPVHKIRRGPKQIPELRSKYADGRIGWRKFEIRSQDTLLRWEIHRESGQVVGMWQQDPYSGRPPVYLELSNCIHFRHHQHKQNPEGRSLFRNTVIPYLRLKRIEEIEAIGIERDLTGLLVMEVPPNLLNLNASAEDLSTKAELEQMLNGIKMDERAFAMIPSELNEEGKPSGFKLRLLQSPGARQLDVVTIKNSYKTDIYQNALVQFLTLGQQTSGGSYSLHSDASSLAAMAIGCVLDNLAETIQIAAVDPLAVLNQIEPEDTPVLKHGDIEKPELEKIAAYVKTLFDTGTLQPSNALVEQLHKLGDLTFDPTESPEAGGMQGLVDALGRKNQPPPVATPVEPKDEQKGPAADDEVKPK